MTNSQIYAQVAGYGVGIGADSQNGITFTFFTGAALGVAGSASWTLTVDLFDVNENFFIDVSAATYIGAGTPIALPLQITGQKNMQTGDIMMTVGAGVSDVFEIGFSYEASESEYKPDFHSIRHDRRYQDEGVVIVSEISGNITGYTLINSYATDLSGNRLSPIEGKQYLQAGGYPMDPSYKSFYIYKTDDSTSHIINDQCFPAGTLIDMWPADATPRADGTYDQTAILAGLWRKPIEDITPADIVVAHDANGNLVPGRVTQLLHNTTDTWLQLSNGTIVTPGHRYLRPDGSFAEIQDIIADDGRIVAADGAIQTITAEVIRYSAETAHMFEEAEMLVYGTSGGVALAA